MRKIESKIVFIIIVNWLVIIEFTKKGAEATNGRKKFRPFFYVLKNSLGSPPQCTTITEIARFLISIENRLLAVL